MGPVAVGVLLENKDFTAPTAPEIPAIIALPAAEAKKRIKRPANQLPASKFPTNFIAFQRFESSLAPQAAAPSIIASQNPFSFSSSGGLSSVALPFM